MNCKVVFFIDSLGIGGAEKVLVGFANALAKTCRFEVVLVSFYDGPISQEIENDVSFICVNHNKKNTFISRLTSRLKKEFFIRYPSFVFKMIPDLLDANVYVSFLENRTIDLVANIDNDGICKKVAWIHTDIRKQDNSQRPKEVSYQHYSDIVFVSELAKLCFNDIYKIKNARLHTIYNGLDFNRIIKLSNEKIVNPQFSPNEKFSISIGRLCEAKDYIGLIDNFSKIKMINQEFRHYIIGDGPFKIKIINHIRDLGLENNIILLGSQSNPYPYIKYARTLVHNSKWEGFGLVLVEAAILNTPIIVRATPTALELHENLNIGKIYSNTKEFVELYMEIMSCDTREPSINDSEKLIKLNCSYDNMVKRFEDLIHD